MSTGKMEKRQQRSFSDSSPTDFARAMCLCCTVQMLALQRGLLAGSGDSYVRKFELTYLYDLSAPGRYTAYAEVLDPSSHRWLRTKR